MLIVQSGNDLKQQMQGRMFDILNSAAALLDGDILESLQKDDYNTPEYQDSLRILRTFQQNFNLDYIYGIRDMGDKTFTFTIDPDLESPGEFGEPIAYTDALYSASLGVAAVDQEPYEDRWGRFYSAYVPVFNSKGKVGGIIAVDVRAEWYEKQQKIHILTTLIICAASLLFGAILVFLISGKFRKRFAHLNSEMRFLTDEVEELARALRIASGRRSNTFEYDDSSMENAESSNKQKSSDQLEELSERLKYVREELQQYIDDAHELAYTDPLTGSANRTAYVEAIKELDDKIYEGEVDFSIAVFDINGLKTSNDNFGHEYGDLMIITAADILKDSVGPENLFRIGGDEFVVIIESSEQEYITELFKAVDSKIEAANQTIPDFTEKAPLAISKGISSYIKNTDSDAQAVFRRADDAMYADKAAYYKAHDRRRR